jgi:MraZ protein
MRRAAFVLPPAAREKLGLDGEALFQGKGRKFHILKPDDGAAADDRVLKMLEKFGEGKEFFNPISLANKRRPDPADVDATMTGQGAATPHLPVLLGRS